MGLHIRWLLQIGRLKLTNGFIPVVGQQFKVLTADSITNNGFVLGGPAASSFNLLFSGSNVILQAIAVELLGDFNNNGVVDAADYTVWRDGLGTTYTFEDYNLWKSHYGQTAGRGSTGASPSQSVVPEPSSLFPLAWGAWGFVLLRARR